MIKLLEHTRRNDITFHRNGMIRISSKLAKMLGLHPGDSINIMVDSNEYLLFAIHNDYTYGRNIARCFPSKTGGMNYCAQSVSLSRSFLEAIGCQKQKQSFMVGQPVILDQVTYVPIITLNPL